MKHNESLVQPCAVRTCWNSQNNHDASVVNKSEVFDASGDKLTLYTQNTHTQTHTHTPQWIMWEDVGVHTTCWNKNPAGDKHVDRSLCAQSQILQPARLTHSVRFWFLCTYETVSFCLS